MKNYTLITGASSGIGKALASVFASKGHKLILVARRQQLLDRLATELNQEYNVKVRIVCCDLTSERNIRDLCSLIQSNRIHIDTLINNAGVGDFAPFLKSDHGKMQKMISLNINAVLSLTHHILPLMVKQGYGQILNVASMAAFSPGPYIAAYAASKSFVLNFTHALASEVKHKNIQVSVLCPGDIKTEFQDNAGLKGFDVQSKITVEELAAYTYKEFVEEGKREIILPETKKMIEMMNRSGNIELISDNMYRLRKKLAEKLGKFK
ncbi:MAG: SDR family oxidoreductase [Bacteroidales bacterium]|nr:SDR family oxidoreductase [Bacteroidales bacterium]MBN2819240.1 SDR family oxidoreductase [Bacteroidales bacterium]